MKIEYGRLEKQDCVVCGKIGTHFFRKSSFFKKEYKTYCKKHLLERVKKEKAK